MHICEVSGRDPKVPYRARTDNKRLNHDRQIVTFGGCPLSYWFSIRLHPSLWSSVAGIVALGHVVSLRGVQEGFSTCPFAGIYLGNMLVPDPVFTPGCIGILKNIAKRKPPYQSLCYIPTLFFHYHEAHSLSGTVKQLEWDQGFHTLRAISNSGCPFSSPSSWSCRYIDV